MGPINKSKLLKAPEFIPMTQQKSLPKEKKYSRKMGNGGNKIGMTARDIRQLSEYRLVPLGIQLMQLIFVRERKQQRSASDTRYLVTVVSLFLKNLLSLDHFTEN